MFIRPPRRVGFGKRAEPARTRFFPLAGLLTTAQLILCRKSCLRWVFRSSSILVSVGRRDDDHPRPTFSAGPAFGSQLICPCQRPYWRDSVIHHLYEHGCCLRSLGARRRAPGYRADSDGIFIPSMCRTFPPAASRGIQPRGLTVHSVTDAQSLFLLWRKNPTGPLLELRQLRALRLRVPFLVVSPFARPTTITVRSLIMHRFLDVSSKSVSEVRLLRDRAGVAAP